MDYQWEQASEASHSADLMQMVAKIERNAAKDATMQAQLSQYTSTDLGMGQVRDYPSGPSRSQQVPAEQFDMEIQDQAMRLVNLDPGIEPLLKKTMPWIEIKHISRTFYPHQLYAAFILLKQQSGEFAGYFETDLMGLGKTATVYLYILLNYYLVFNEQHVAQNPSHHLKPQPPGMHTSFGNRVCPMQSEWPIQCCCQPGAVSQTLRPRYGASLIFVPRSLLGNWQSEWQRLGVSAQLDVHLHIHHGDYNNSKIPKVDLGQIKRQGVQNGRNPVAEPPMTSRAHGYIILTTFLSYHTHLAQYAGNRPRAYRPPVPGENPNVSRTDGYFWGRLVVDEAHTRSNESTDTHELLKSLMLPVDNPPFLVPLTGSPMMRFSISDMLPWISLMNSVSHPRPLPATRDLSDEDAEVYLERLSIRFHTFNSRSISREGGIVSEEGHKLPKEVGDVLAAYCIRRYCNSFQNGKELTRIPPLEHIDLVLTKHNQVQRRRFGQVKQMLKKKLDRNLTEALRAWRQSGNSDADFELDHDDLVNNVPHHGMVVATVPSLAEVSRPGDLNWEYVKKQEWHINWSTSPHSRRIAHHIASSAKLQELERFINKWRHCQTWDGEPEKLVIMSCYPIICHLVLCHIKKLDITCEWIHADTKTGTRQQIIDRFQDEQQGHNQPRLRVLISTTEILGQGATLNRAHRLILMEPDNCAAFEEQIAKRVHRLGSKTDRCWFYRMIGSKWEMSIVAYTDAQREFNRRVERLD